MSDGFPVMKEVQRTGEWPRSWGVMIGICPVSNCWLL
jgi:hypothetical protein